MLKFGVIKQNLYIIDNDYLASDSQNYVTATFEFDADWTGFTKTAVFYQNADTVYHQLLSNNQCVVPYEVLADASKIYIGVFGVKDTQRITTNFANLSIIQGSYGDGLTPEAPTADIYAQIIAIMEQQAVDAQAAEAAQQAAEDARDASIAAKDIAVGASEDALDSAEAAQISETNAKTSETNAKTSEDNAQLSENACEDYYNQMSNNFVEKQEGYELLATVDKERLANTSGTNTGDQDLSPYLTIESAENTYEPLLPVTPENPETKFLNGNRQWANIAIGNGGYAANLYFTTESSDISGYYKIDYSFQETETILSAVVNNQELLLRTYLFDNAIGTTSIDAGSWVASFTAKVSSNTGVTNLKGEAFLRHIDGTETILFSAYSPELNNNAEYLVIKTESNQPSFSCVETDRLGIRIYGKTNSVSNITINTIVGDGRAGYFTTPLRLRHNQLRDINGDNIYLHITSTEKSGYDNASSKAHSQNTDMQLKSPDGTKTPLYTDNSGSVHIDGNIYQQGSAYETHAEQFYTKKDTIILRDGATAGLGNGEYAGFVAKKYDGANDGHLVFDKDGIARVGDVGGEQPLATREENPLDSGFAKWNSTTLRFETFNPTTDNITESSTKLYVNPTEKNTWNGKQDAINIPQYNIPYRDASGVGTVNTYKPLNSGSAAVNSIVGRDANGCIFTATPTNNAHATTKLYVDTNLPYFQTKTTLDATLLLGTRYELGTLTSNISMALTTPSGATNQRILVKFDCTGTAYTFTLTGTNFNTFTLTPVINTMYDVEFEWNNAKGKWTAYMNSYIA